MVLHYASHLADSGYDVSFISEEPLPRNLNKWFSKAEKCRRLSYQEASRESFDIAIITFWSLIFRIPSFPAKKFINFVQRVEYEACVSKSTGKLIRELYKFPFDTIVVSNYIREVFAERHHLPADRLSVVYNGIDKNIFYAGKQIQDDKLKVLVEGPVTIPFKNVAAAVNAARKGGADEINLLTSSPINDFPGVDNVFSQVPPEKTAEVYRKSNVLVKMSLVEGMCLPPLEIFHCGGTAVMYDLPPVGDYALNQRNCLLVPIGDEAGIIKAVRMLKENHTMRNKLITNAIASAAKWPSLNESAIEFEKALGRAQPRPEIIAGLHAVARKHLLAMAALKLKRRLRRLQSAFRNLKQ